MALRGGSPADHGQRNGSDDRSPLLRLMAMVRMDAVRSDVGQQFLVALDDVI